MIASLLSGCTADGTRVPVIDTSSKLNIRQIGSPPRREYTVTCVLAIRTPSSGLDPSIAASSCIESRVSGYYTPTGAGEPNMSLNSFKDIFATLSFGYRVGRSMLPGSVNNRRHYTTCAAAPASERNPLPGVRNEVAQTLTFPRVREDRPMYHRVAQRSLRSVSPRARGHDYHREHQEHVETRTNYPCASYNASAISELQLFLCERRPRKRVASLWTTLAIRFV